MDDAQTDADQNVVVRRRREAFLLAIDEDVGGGGFGNVAVLVEQDCPSARLTLGGFAIGQIVVHTAAALELGGPTRVRHLADAADDGGEAAVVLRGPAGEIKRAAVDADGWRAGTEGPGVAKAVIDQSLPAGRLPWFRVTNSGIAAAKACVMVEPSRPTISSECRMRVRCCSRRNTFPPKVRSFSVTVVPSKKPRSSTSIASWARGIQLPFR